LLYIPGRIVHHASATYRGDGKTDAKDAAIIADQARMRRDLQPVRGGDQISVDLRIMSARRTDLICDRSVRSTASARHCWNTSRHWSGRSTIPRTKPRSPSHRPTRPLTRCAGSASPGSGPGWRPGAAATAPASPKKRSMLPTANTPPCRPNGSAPSWSQSSQPRSTCRTPGGVTDCLVFCQPSPPVHRSRWPEHFFIRLLTQRGPTFTGCLGGVRARRWQASCLATTTWSRRY
jgi:hypothetical protein